MPNEPNPFDQAHTQYRWRLWAAVGSTAITAASGRLLYTGAAGTYWTTILIVTCVTLSAAVLLTLDVSQRWSHVRRLRLVEDAPKPYGFTGTVDPQEAARDMGRKPAHARRSTRH